MSGLKRPTLIFDGDCGFCRRWVDLWRGWTGDKVDYVPSKTRGDRFPQVSDAMVKDSVVLVDGEGRMFLEAEAVFATLAVDPSKAWLSWCFRHLPGFAAVSNGFYRWVARRRMAFSQLTRWFLGKDPSYHQYFIARRVFLFALGLIYAVAFFSYGVQVQGLNGSRGILPAASFLAAVGPRLEHPFLSLPSLFWINSSDLFLSGVCYTGVVLGLLLAAGWGSFFVSAALWFLYLSLFSVGQIFLGYQWDILLLEAGFLAIFLTPLGGSPGKAGQTRPSTFVLWMFRWLLFRLMLQSGMVKLLSGDPSWRDGSAMSYHYWSQPLPNPLSYWASLLPAWFQRESTFLMFVIELGLPFFIFFPSPIRRLAAFGLIGFQLLLMATGNYGFFNLLTIALCLLLIADHYWPAWLKRRLLPNGYGAPGVGKRFWRRYLLIPVLIPVLVLSVLRMEDRFSRGREAPGWLNRITHRLAPFQLSNSYGLFAVMTKRRPEITVEGSMDGVDWRAYRFKYKPNGAREIPPFLIGHMPRLDWQMWFASLRPPMRYRYWFDQFLTRLLEGSPPVLGLLEDNPFPEAPPKMVRAIVADYRFAPYGEFKKTGDYWTVGAYLPYSPVYELGEDGKVERYAPSSLPRNPR